jgi:hypothetical protein
MREYDLLIREGWMDGKQNGKRLTFPFQDFCFLKDGDTILGGNTGKVTLQKKLTSAKQFWKKKKSEIRGKYSLQHGSYGIINL